tara:strand:- start:38949 stop:39134 length:186 start_codon:yes stop_codon:yes gene_type:complete
MSDLIEALQWYAAQVEDCRKHGRDGDIARAKLDRDGGHKARQALEAIPNAPQPLISPKDPT